MPEDRLQREEFGDPTMGRFQEGLSQAMQSMEGDLEGNLIEDVALSTTATEIEHGLGRAWREYTVCKRSAGATVYDAEGSDDSKFISLTATAAVTVSLRVR